MDLGDLINPSPKVYDVAPIKRETRRTPNTVTEDDQNAEQLFNSILGPKYIKKPLEEIGTIDEDEVADSEEDEEIDELEIYDLLRNIKDPEHPLTLEQLKVAQHSLINIDQLTKTITVQFTPTITHCSMATLIGLCIRVKLLRSIPKTYKVDIKVSQGSHESENAVNRQLNDKERVAAALENSKLLSVVDKCIIHS
ncbi:hypothetical protein AKO1_013412 [Acrasis kona]|uniref:MIP18 family-like domain-containing protein n=1 Tax=Acrasis kona TaxID=1008807 RepID=A0AAW2YKJ4_9EUKA